MFKYPVAVAGCALVTVAACIFEYGSTHAGPQTASSPSSQSATTQGAREGSTLRFVERLQNRKRNDDEADITAMAESADGKRLAWGDDKGTVRVHSFVDNKTRTVLNLSDLDITARRTIRDLAFDEKGRLWWVDASRNIYRSESMANKDAQNEKVATAAEVNVVSSNLLPWGALSTRNRLAWPPKQYLRLLEVEGGKIHESDIVFPIQRGANEVVRRAVRSSDGNLLIAVADGDAALLSLPDMKILRRFGQGWGESAAFSPSSKLVALGTDGRGVFVWETETGKLVKKIPFRRAAVIDSLVFVGKGVLYAADYPLCRIDIKAGTIASVAEVNACMLLLSRSGDRLFVGIHEGGVEVYELPLTDARQQQTTSLPISNATR